MEKKHFQGNSPTSEIAGNAHSCSEQADELHGFWTVFVVNENISPSVLK